MWAEAAAGTSITARGIFKPLKVVSHESPEGLVTASMLEGAVPAAPGGGGLSIVEIIFTGLSKAQTKWLKPALM